MAKSYFTTIQVIFACLTSLAHSGKVPRGLEPKRCDSTFDFNNKLLEKMVKVAHRLELLEDKLDNELGDLKQSVTEVQSEMAKMEAERQSRPATGSCPDGWIMFKTSCYYWDTRQLDFNSAKDACSTLNGKLAEIETPHEDAFIRDLLRKCDGDKFWIGLTDLEVEGVWHFPGETTPISYDNWGTSQPNNGRVSNCGAIWKSFSYNWVDEPCQNKFQPVCEMPSKQE